MSSDEKLNKLAYEIMEILEPHGPRDALEAMTVALGSVIICSVKSQLDAINVMKEIVDTVMHTIEEYEHHTPCHWEHEN